jgi:hypothetical protein
MKLTELDPQWIMKDGQRVGFTFLTPSYTNAFWAQNRKPAEPHPCRQSCFLESPQTKDQWRLFAETHGAEAGDDDFPRHMIQGCTPGARWTISGEFENLTVTPSIDGSAGGNWHGFITNGEIVGGL